MLSPTHDTRTTSAAAKWTMKKIADTPASLKMVVLCVFIKFKTSSLFLRQFEIVAQPDVSRRTADLDFKAVRLRHPRFLAVVIIRKRTFVQRSRNGLFFAGPQKDFSETFQLFFRPCQARIFFVDVKLRHFRA